jgi:hypothetical protein
MSASELAHMVLNKDVIKDGLELEVLTSFFEIIMENHKVNEKKLMYVIMDALLEWNCLELECGC